VQAYCVVSSLQAKYCKKEPVNFGNFHYHTVIIITSNYQSLPNKQTPINPQQQKQVCNRLNSLVVYLGFCLRQIVNVTSLEPAPSQKQIQNEHSSINCG
jgi:hypothetical protein